MLGHVVAFSYCRSPGSAEPCRRILNCWWEEFDVEAFVRRHYGDEQIERFRRPRTDKVSTLMELIERAKSAARQDGGGEG